MSAGYMRRCAGKKRHETRENADDARDLLCSDQGLKKAALHVYRCDQCLGWHVGGPQGRYMTRRRRPGKRANKRMRGRV